MIVWSLPPFPHETSSLHNLDLVANFLFLLTPATQHRIVTHWAFLEPLLKISHLIVLLHYHPPQTPTNPLPSRTTRVNQFSSTEQLEHGINPPAPLLRSSVLYHLPVSFYTFWQSFSPFPKEHASTPSRNHSLFLELYLPPSSWTSTEILKDLDFIPNQHFPPFISLLYQILGSVPTILAEFEIEIKVRPSLP